MAPSIKFFLDNNVADSVGVLLRDMGHEVILLREKLAPDSPDPVVATVSELFEAILVSHDGDFDILAARTGIGKRRFKRLSRVRLRCSEPQAASRIKLSLSLIEHEWKLAQASADKRMIIEITQTGIKTIR